jgi:hypothetical protein
VRRQLPSALTDSRIGGILNDPLTGQQGDLVLQEHPGCCRVGDEHGLLQHRGIGWHRDK